MTLSAIQLIGMFVFVYWSSCAIAGVTDGLTVEEQLRENYTILENNIKKEIQKSLETRIGRLESKLAEMIRINEKLESRISKIDGDNRLIPVTGMPRSCSDLRDRGHLASGLYLVIGNKSVETVHCDFCKLKNDSSFQKLVGYADVKSVPTYFYAQLSKLLYYNSSFDEYIAIDQIIVNIGGAYNGTAGVFKAPVKGKYFFSFVGQVRFLPSNITNSFWVKLMKNGNLVASNVESGVGGLNRNLPLQSTLTLLAGDYINLQTVFVSAGWLVGGSTFSQSYFSGFLLEEDISP